MDTQNDVFVHLMNLPTSVKGRAILNDDDTYTIVINSKISHDEQLRAYHHELEHIKNGDFEKNDVQQIEAIAHSVQTPKENPVSVVVQKRKRRRRNRYGQYEKQRRALAAFGVDAWSQHEAHWLDPDYRF